MSIKKRFVFTLSTVCLMIVAAAPSYHRTRPCVRCAIPDRDYQYQKFSQPQRSLSNVAVLIETPRIGTRNLGEGVSRAIVASEAAPQLRIKSFQFVKDPTLDIDHCSISQMSVLLHESGRWTVSLRANQNPLNVQPPLNVTTSQPIRLFTDHLQRNKFHIVARCYVQHGPGDSDALIGKPMVIPLYVKPFRVQRQEPYQVFEAEFHPHIQQYFELIDRVEIEFAYQLD
jgi:hypothetical protein